MTFLNPLFLLGTVLVAVPILIHLWFRKRLKRIPFSALQFLKSTEARRFGWLKLREWLILAARCLFILFLFLSLARPNLRTSVFKIGRLSSVFVIIDNSYSMAYGDNFERMKDLALQVISMYSSNSEFCIVPLCSTTDSIGTFWMSGKSAKHAVQKARLAYEQVSMRTALSNTPAREAKNDVEYVYIGDGQAANFRDFEAETTGEGTFYWVKIPAGGNVGILSVSLQDPVAVPLDDYTLEVAVVSHSRRPWSGKIGLAGGDYYDEQEATVQPGAEGRYEFQAPSHLLTGEVTIFDDSLLTDNVYYFRKRLPGLVRVLVIGDSPYLVQALMPQSGSNAPFVVQTTEQLGTRDLRDYDVLVLDGVQSISENERLRMADHLRKPGAGLVITLEGGVASNLAELLSDWCKIHDSVAPKGYVILDWIDNDHPIFKIFEGSGALRDVQCYRYVQTEAKSGVIARFSSGDPFIVVNDNVALISTRLNEQNTSFVYNRAFVPVLLRLIVNMVQGHERMEYYVGERIVQGGSVKTPTGELLRAGDEFRVAGFYSVDGETLCVNVRPEEGNLEILGPERARILNIEQLDPHQDLTGSDLSSFFLVLALLSILLELGLIWLR
jgi:hypothetical protein